MESNKVPLHTILTKMVRPVLTYVAFTIYILGSTAGLFMGKVNYDIWFSQIGTMVSMMISWYFAERSALKDPSKGSDTHE